MTNAVNLSALGSNGGTSVSTWTTGTRPASPITGQTGFNTTLGSLESYNGSAWVSGGGLNIQAVQTTGFTAVAGNIYPCNTTSAAFTVTLPASPIAGNQIQIIDYAGTFGTNNVTLGRNGLNITGQASNYLLTTNRESVILTYIDSTQGWVVSSAAYTTAPLTAAPYSVEYLIVAGGGGGGSAAGDAYYGGGGGGAGGLLQSSISVSPLTAYTITVGSGGGGGTGSNRGTVGNNSSAFSQTSIGGGGGGGYGNGSQSGSAGGSGGGGRPEGTGGAGTAGQGNAGGTSSLGGGSGGGGAGAVGSSNSGNNGGNGGVGINWQSLGTFYAGGGGGGSFSSGSGGSGGSGGGGNANSAGTTNTGGGGGGGNSYSAGSSGGSGIVIVRYSGSQRGTGGTVTSAGGFTYHTFTASSSYTA
jgi:hypothetical protein